MSDWGPWIECDGTGCPEPAGVWMYLVVLSDGRLKEGEGRLSEEDRRCHCWTWTMGQQALRYRIRRPRGLEQLRELVADPPPMAPVPELEDA